MAYDEPLADRIRRAVAALDGVTEKRMFGGLAFLLDGRMFCGIAKSDLMVRVGPANFAAALARAHVRPMDFTGRPLNGYVYVGPAGTRTQQAIERWVALSVGFVAALGAAPKKPKKPKINRRTARRPQR